ncbi:MAG: N-acetylmuramoyl-L-alanine amidase [Bacteroidota bacterium]|jgi:uncharacterized lipoprotein YddW (UPF0748 family)
MKSAFFAFTILLSSIITVSAGPKRELRGVWIATVQNIDWPSNRNFNSITQREEFSNILNSHQQTGINAVFVQVRIASDALYAKSKEPWASVLSGLQGQAPIPYYDPLEFMIQESHNRGIEFHAWLNLNRANLSTKNLLSSEHIARKHPEWLLLYNGQHIFNFGLPEVRNYIEEVVRNLVQNYNIDGIHFDDYFYPYPSANSSIKDQEAFEKYKYPNERIEDWRRRNIDILIQNISYIIKQEKPKVKFGISPFGIYRHKTLNYEEGSPTRKGLQSYIDLFADTEKWIKEGWVDYIAPQLYWPTNHGVAPYGPLLSWWSTHSYERPVYAGIGAYHLKDSWSTNELSKQLQLARSNSKVQGSIYFSSKLLTQNTKGWRDSLRRNHFKEVALVPTMPWIDSIPPKAPHQISLVKKEGEWQLDWKSGEPAADQDPVAYYLVYRFKKTDIDPFEQAEHIIYKGRNTHLNIPNNWMSSGYGFAVTACDRMHNESTPGTIQWVIAVEEEHKKEN